MASKLLLLVLLAALTHTLNADKGAIIIEKKFWKHFPSCSGTTKGGGFSYGGGPGVAWLGGSGGRAGLRGGYGSRPGVGYQGGGKGASSGTISSGGAVAATAGGHRVGIGARLP